MNGDVYSDRQRRVSALHDWFLDNSAGVAPQILGANLAEGIHLSDGWHVHTLFLYHAAKKASLAERDKRAVIENSPRDRDCQEARDRARQAVRQHLRAWSDKALSFSSMPQPWCIPHSLRAFGMLHVRPPAKYVELCQKVSAASLRRSDKGTMLEWFDVGADLTLEFQPGFVRSLCERAAELAPKLEGHELYTLARKMAIMDAVHQTRTGERSEHIGTAFRRIYHHPQCLAQMDRAETNQRARSLAEARFWFGSEEPPVRSEPEQCSALQKQIAFKFQSAGARTSKPRLAGDGHKLDLSFHFQKCDFDIEVDGPDHFVRSTDGHVITLNGSSIFQTQLTRLRSPDSKLIRFPYTAYDANQDKRMVWNDLCRDIRKAATGAYLVTTKGALTPDLLARCEIVRASAPADKVSPA